MIGAFLVVRVAEAALCILLLALATMIGAPHAGGVPADASAAWARHELLYGFVAVQALAWRGFGRLIELRVIALTVAAVVYALVAGHGLAFTLCFIVAQAVTELGVWWRMQLM